MMEVGIFLVCVAVSAYLGAKATREVFHTTQEHKVQKAASPALTEEEKRKADCAERELQNFMTYSGKAQEGHHDY